MNAEIAMEKETNGNNYQLTTIQDPWHVIWQRFECFDYVIDQPSIHPSKQQFIVGVLHRNISSHIRSIQIIK